MTKMKSMILAGALALSSVALAGPNTYNIHLNEQAVAGGTQLNAGEYRLNVSGHVAKLTNLETNQSVFLLIRVENGLDTFGHTAIDLKKVDGVQHLESIELEDSNSRLEF